MEITYFGHASFRIKGKSSTVVIDPYSEKVGKFPKGVEANILLVTHEHFDHNEVNKVEGKPFLINCPGEYEVGGVSIIGVPTRHDSEGGAARGVNTIYVIEMDGMRLAHLGDLGHKLEESQLEEMGSVDLVMVPVGGTYTLDARGAAEVVKQVDPVMVIPMHYKMEDSVGELKNLAGVESFLKEMGKPEVLPVNKLSVSVDKLPTELQVVILEKK